MKIASLVVFKNEADILPAWLKHYENQVDYFLFRDNESTDNGLEIVKKHPKTVFTEIVKGTFYTNMWDKLIDEAQKFLGSEDWFTIAAPDLFPFFSMKEEIGKLAGSSYNCIETYYPVFFFTKEMYQKYIKFPIYQQKIDEFDISHYSYFQVTGHKMPLLIKNVNNEKGRVRYTKPKQEPPFIPGMNSYKSELCIGHYRFRSPQQMQQRMVVRKKVNPNREKSKSFKHYPTWNWENYLLPEKYLHKFEGAFVRNQLNIVSLDKLLSKMK